MDGATTNQVEQQENEMFQHVLGKIAASNGGWILRQNMTREEVAAAEIAVAAGELDRFMVRYMPDSCQLVAYGKINEEVSNAAS